MLKDFKAFILRGNVIDLAIGVVIGAAFATVIGSFTDGIISPLLGLFGDANFDTLDACIGDCGFDEAGKPVGSLFAYGKLLTALITFLITAAVLFFFVVKPVNHLMARRKTEPEVDSTVKECPRCLSSIPTAASRCAFCAADL